MRSLAFVVLGLVAFPYQSHNLATRHAIGKLFQMRDRCRTFERVKSLQAPLGHIPLIPTGGVTVDNAKEFLSAGAIAVGLSRELFPQQLVDARAWEAIALRCQTLLRQL